MWLLIKCEGINTASQVWRQVSGAWPSLVGLPMLVNLIVTTDEVRSTLLPMLVNLIVTTDEVRSTLLPMLVNLIVTVGAPHRDLTFRLQTRDRGGATMRWSWLSE